MLWQAREVLRWKAEQPEIANALWSELANTNLNISMGLQTLLALQKVFQFFYKSISGTALMVNCRL